MKKMKKFLAGLIASATMLSCAPLTANAVLEQTDVDGYDLYSRDVHYYKNEDGEMVPVYYDTYYKFSSYSGGTYYQFNEEYEYVSVVLEDEAALAELESVLGEPLDEDIVFYYDILPNQYFYRYSPDFDYYSLYNIAGVEHVQLANSRNISKFYIDFYFDMHDTWAEENGIDEGNNNLVMSKVSTDGSVELTPEMFDSTGFDVKHVFEEAPNSWLVYFEYDGIKSYTDFDIEAQKLDGVICSGVSLVFLGIASGDLIFENVKAPTGRGEDIVDMDKIIFSIRNYETSSPVYKYTEFLIDENYNINHSHVWAPDSVIVRMTDGSSPELNDGLKSEKLSKYQIGKMRYGAGWASYIDVKDLEITDDVYYITGFENEDNANAYCDELLKSGKADCAEPVSYVDVSIAYADSWDLTSSLERMGIDCDDFTENTFGFELVFDSAEEAESFDVSSIEGFAENLHASVIKDNVMYFQLTKEAEGEKMVNVLLALQEAEAVNELDVMGYYFLESVGESFGELPEDYAMGDTDYNNDVNLYDVINISKHIMGMEQLDELQQLLADYDDNGEVNLYDAVEIAKTLM